MIILKEMNFKNLKTKRLILISCILYFTGSLNPVLAIENKSTTVILPTIPADTFNISSYGAESSTTLDNTLAIQQTINACSTAGGGVVLIPEGTFLSGPLAMKSKINLCIASGSILRILPYGSGNGTVAGTYPNSGTTNDYTDFIYGKNLNNIAVTGSGTLDGNGTDWWVAYRASSAIARPCLIRFDGCSYVLISGIRVQNAPNVHITIGKTGSNATLKNLTITAPSDAPNSDGIDTWSPNINILNCNIAVGDDNIAMDSGSQNVTVKNCVFGTGHGCSVGSYASGVGNILVDSCSFTNTTSGIRLKTARGRGGVEQYFTYSNITMSGVTTPFFFSSYYPKEPASPSADIAQAITSTTPSWQHILLKNIQVTGSSQAGIIWGLPEQSISDVVFDNVSISATTGMKAYFVAGLVFKNGSYIAVTGGSAVTTYSTSVSGINLTTGKADISRLDDTQNRLIQCYPNPLKDGMLKVTAPCSIDSIRITTVGGIQVKNITCNSSTLTQNVSDLPKGIYIVDIVLIDKSFLIQRIII